MGSLRRWRQLGQGQLWETPGQEFEGTWQGIHDGRFGPLGTLEAAEGRLTFPLELPRFRGRGTAFGLRDDWVPLFIADRRQIVQPGMPPVRVVPALDEVEDRHPGLGLGGEAVYAA
jgi:hypothetical protein